MVTRRLFLALVLLGASLAAVPPVVTGPAAADDRFITVASTTSTENSGLFGHILPQFRDASGIEVRVVAVGTGAALKLGETGDADVLLVHAKPAEEKFVADGFGAFRRDVMYNDFVIVGPGGDPAGIFGLQDAPEALGRIARTRSEFISRGDNSGTHKAEMRLWREAGVSPESGSGAWYKETGQGMGAVLNTAASLDGYALADRGTWLSFANRGTLQIVVEGDPRLFNQYGVILVNPERHPHVKTADAKTFIDWLTGAEGQRAIADFRIDGQQLFTPNARSSRSTM